MAASWIKQKCSNDVLDPPTTEPPPVCRCSMIRHRAMIAAQVSGFPVVKSLARLLSNHVTRTLVFLDTEKARGGETDAPLV
jgi:hypothetical protein